MPAPTDHPDVLDSLDRLLAAERARDGLDGEVRDVLTWPTDLPAYRSCLRDFLRWIPQETDHPAWREPDRPTAAPGR